MIIFSYFEGQVRILLGYNPVARIPFDILLVIGILRTFIIQKKFIDMERIPPLIVRFMVIHLAWWTLELFNPTGAGPLPTFATAKYYVFPFFLFFALSLRPIDIKSKFFQQFLIIMLIITFLECALCIHQMGQGAELLWKISGNYKNLFKKFSNFEGFFFRPWGTTHAPGSAAILLYLSLPLSFLVDFSFFKSKKFRVFILTSIVVIILLSWFTLFISQIRSALIKHLLITATYSLIYFTVAKNKAGLIVRTGFFIVIIGAIIALNQNAYNKLDKELNLTSSLDRLEVLANSNVTDHRSGFLHALGYAWEKTVYPLGYGPGMCTSYLPHYGRQRARLIEYDKNDFWALDNLYVFLSLELGVGFFSYIGSIFTIVLFTSLRTLVLLRRGHFDKVKSLIPSLTIFYILIIGNWGAIALPFNPESFYFWLYASIAVSVAFSREVKEDGEVENKVEKDEDSTALIAS